MPRISYAFRCISYYNNILYTQLKLQQSGRAHSIDDDVVAMSSPAPNPNCPYVLPSSSACDSTGLEARLRLRAEATHIER